MARVVARLDGIEGTPGTTAFDEAVRTAAELWLDARHPGDWNEALMDLGRVVCTPRAPQCGRCPLAPACAARAANRQETIPRPRARSRRTVPVAVAVVLGPEGLLVEPQLRRRDEAGFSQDRLRLFALLNAAEDAAAAGEPRAVCAG